MKGPEDLGPQREDTTRAVEDDEEVDNVLDDDDDDDDDDAPPAPCEAPVGFRIVDEPPSLAALTPKDPRPAQQMLVGRSMLYCWLSVGWCVGVIKEANGDRRRKMDGEVINLFTHYEIDDDTRSACPWHVLTLHVYGARRGGYRIVQVLLEPEME